MGESDQEKHVQMAVNRFESTVCEHVLSLGGISKISAQKEQS